MNFSLINPPSLCHYFTVGGVGSFEGSQWELKHCPESHLTCYLVIPVLAPRLPFLSFFFFNIFLSLALVQSLQQVSLYAEPVQSLPDVSDQLGHAALLTQRLHHRVQLLEELYKGGWGRDTVTEGYCICCC